MGIVTIATLLLFLGATGKSAQIPLYVWLPDAMEGPTPVSALIHAATMVTAGVYMIGRNAVLFRHAPETLAVVAVVGAATALMAGTIGLVQNDIKRVLAYSTVSQLGYMFLAMGVGAYAAGIFHLYTHAFFKALLFLGSGAVIHALHGRAGPAQHGRAEEGAADHLLDVPDRRDRDCRRAAAWPGSSARTKSCFGRSPAATLLLWAIGIVTSLLTATYMFRLVFLAFHGERRHDAPPERPEEEEPAAQAGAGAHAAHPASRIPDPGHGQSHGHGGHLHDAPPAMAIALIVLAIGSVLAGFVGVPHALGGRTASRRSSSQRSRPIEPPLVNSDRPSRAPSSPRRPLNPTRRVRRRTSERN